MKRLWFCTTETNPSHPFSHLSYRPLHPWTSSLLLYHTRGRRPSLMVPKLFPVSVSKGSRDEILGYLEDKRTSRRGDSWDTYFNLTQNPTSDGWDGIHMTLPPSPTITPKRQYLTPPDSSISISSIVNNRPGPRGGKTTRLQLWSLVSVVEGLWGLLFHFLLESGGRDSLPWVDPRYTSRETVLYEPRSQE